MLVRVVFLEFSVEFFVGFVEVLDNFLHLINLEVEQHLFLC